MPRVVIVVGKDHDRCPDTRRAVEFYDLFSGDLRIEYVNQGTGKARELWAAAAGCLGHGEVEPPLVLVQENKNVLWARAKPADHELIETLPFLKK